MVKYFQTPGGSVIKLEGPDEESISLNVSPDWTEATEADHIAQAAATAAAIQAAKDANSAGNLALAQDVYDEIVGIHPISALALARVIHPGFEP